MHTRYPRVALKVMVYLSGVRATEAPPLFSTLTDAPVPVTVTVGPYELLCVGPVNPSGQMMSVTAAP